MLFNLNEDTEQNMPATYATNLPVASQHQTGSNTHIETDIATKMEDDKKLVAATLLAMETGDLTPLIKEELKYTIQSRRVAEGKGELSVDFTPPGPSKLTPEEELRVERRREQNRLAARRFRRRQKETSSVQVKRIQKIEVNNTRLRDEIRSLRQEKEQLTQRLTDHLRVCPGVGSNITTNIYIPGVGT